MINTPGSWRRRSPNPSGRSRSPTTSDADARVAYLREKLVGAASKQKLDDVNLIDQVKKHETMEKIKLISDRLTRTYDSDLKTFESLSEKLKVITTSIEKQQSRRDEIETSKRKDLRQLSQNFMREVQVN